MKIIMVEREKLLGYSYTIHLKQVGHEVIYLGQGQDLLPTIEREKPGAIILGIKITGYGYFELLEQVKAAYPQLPVIFSTSLTDLWVEAQDKGADFFDDKSGDLSNIKEIIERLDKKQKGEANER